MAVTTKERGRRRETRRFSLLLKLAPKGFLQERERRVFGGCSHSFIFHGINFLYAFEV
jgi:hypothetical protein